jgi:hypothetical protein
MKLDSREYIFTTSQNYKVIFYQAELLRIIKLLKSLKSDCLARKFIRIIFLTDYNSNTKTDWKRKPTKKDIAKEIMNKQDYRQYIYNQRELDKLIGDYYGWKRK